MCNLINIKNNHQWYLINAKDRILGRLSTKIVYYLQGKHKAIYAPYLDVGDYVIVINAKYIKITGNKYKNKFYYSHSGYAGGLKKISYEKLLILNPKKIIQHAIKGMLPKNKISNVFFKRLKIYSENIHKHIAQQPNIINI
ncbi:50S ribosomal protein L13 [Enterobacteriaceae endosymbiont of Neohaemonia nigricornis]|uniref:50S ribosomal protein L13 n=1 Tax=Enterobacteriaceae endosymbiont of Neohaemonia nigricornis TaxID=2675792 RepID=UPI001448CADE|nr:50S ribosomal protein L13 [Enterobacteriaceae endosymbiont of Neohaemonia nigricornis]QJC30611.1 50S ribosomal protein L13 [Enterobacteriaceae endosymbiont of Neohaemonia nigricornis]